MPPGAQGYDRYAYVNNDPVMYNDPSGHWLETALDIAFILYDTVQIANEGWTPTNTAALALDIACAILPVATGGGPALRAAVAGGEAISVYAKTAVKVPEVIRIGQGIEKAVQFAASNTSGETSHTQRGREAHDNYPNTLNGNYEYNKKLPSGKRPDAVDWDNGIVRELKPNNSRAIQRGWNQIRKYLSELAEIRPDKIWQGFVDTYKK